MNFSADELNILKIYISSKREDTIDNLQIADTYFRCSSCNNIYNNLKEKIEKISDLEFSNIYKLFN